MNLQWLSFVLVVASLGSSVISGLLSGKFFTTQKPRHKYAKEERQISTTYCMLLCGRKEGCIGVGIEKVGQRVNCYFFNLNEQGAEDVVPPPGIEYWIDNAYVGYTSMGGRGCYYPVLSGETVTWAEAEKACQNMNPSSHPISLETEQEVVSLKEFLAANGGTTIWTGGQDLDQDGMFTWIGRIGGGAGEISSDRWHPGEPGGGPSQLCTNIYAKSALGDTYCEADSYHYICEIDMTTYENLTIHS